MTAADAELVDQACKGLQQLHLDSVLDDSCTLMSALAASGNTRLARLQLSHSPWAADSSTFNSHEQLQTLASLPALATLELQEIDFRALFDPTCSSMLQKVTSVVRPKATDPMCE